MVWKHQSLLVVFTGHRRGIYHAISTAPFDLIVAYRLVPLSVLIYRRII